MAHDPKLDSLYADLLGSGGGEKLGLLGRGKKWAGTKAGKLSIGSIFAMLIADKLLGERHQAGLRGIESERITRQTQMATPENLILQAALPQAQQEEQMARTALLSQISGGVLGSTLARGERRIGG